MNNDLNEKRRPLLLDDLLDPTKRELRFMAYMDESKDEAYKALYQLQLKINDEDDDDIFNEILSIVKSFSMRALELGIHAGYWEQYINPYKFIKKIP